MFLPAIGFSIGHQTGPHQALQPLQNKIQGLSQNLTAGALTGAQKTFPAVQQDLQKVQSGQQSNQTTNSTNSLSTGIQGVAQSLSSGDLSGAQKAAANLEQALQAVLASQGGQHQHHHLAVGASQAAAKYANNINTTGSNSLQAGGSNVKVSA
jgi:hypothetical protein